MRKIRLLITLPLLLFFSVPSLASQEAKRVLSLVDYIGGDYGNAVRKGTVINQDEYREMLEFSSEALDLFRKLNPPDGDKAKIEAGLVKLKKEIENRSPLEDVQSVARGIKASIISAYRIETYPKNNPSFHAGKDLYERNCAKCHGVFGAGNGPLSSGFNPPPTDFTNGGTMGRLSPFKIYNTMSFGIEGTAMPPFSELSEEEKWDIAFYIQSLRFSEKEAEDGKEVMERAGIPPDIKDIKNLATLSDEEIQKEIAPYVGGEDLSKVVAFLRRGTGETEEKEEDPLVIASNLLKESMALYEKGNKQEAYTKALDSYLEGFERVEPKLALKDKEIKYEIESKFARLRDAIKDERSPDEVKAIYREIESNLSRASLVLQNGKPVGNAISFINSFAIIIREGLEAALIVAAVIAFLSATGASDSIKYVHLGWVLALLAGFITWVLAQTVISISGAKREVIEGVTSLLAAVVLFYVSYWLITKIEVRKWKEYIQGKVKKAISKKSVFALASVSFFAVYREAFETVLFYQALWLQEVNSQGAVIWGLITGTVLLLGLVVVVFKLGLRIPLKYFFSITSSLLYFLSFVFAGKGIRELQEAGIIGITPLGFIPQVDIIGLYPTLETTILQGILLVAFVVALLWTGFIKGEREKKEIAVSVSRIADDMKSMHEAFEHIKGHIIEWKRCEEIDLEAEELDRQIQDVIRYVDELENKLEDFFDVVSKNREKDDKGAVNRKPLPN
jgi:high-affinity iron transporter